MRLHDLLHPEKLRDTTPNPPGEVLRRVLTVAMAAGLALGAVLLPLAWAGRDEARLGVAYACLAVGLVLLATRRRWRGGPARDTAEATSKENADTRAAAVPAAASSRARPASGRGDDAESGARSDAPARPRVLLLNASAAGAAGNSARLLAEVGRLMEGRAELARATLAGDGAVDFARLEPMLRGCDALVIATGTHWDSWSAPLQKFLEDATPTEAGPLWLGKPAAVLVTEHSTGGKGVLSRLQGVLTTFGCSIPPLSGLVLSQAVQLARRHAPEPTATEDFWSPEDLGVVAHNLLAAARGPRPEWRAWPVDRKNFARAWLEFEPAKD